MRPGGGALYFLNQISIIHDSLSLQVESTAKNVCFKFFLQKNAVKWRMNLAIKMIFDIIKRKTRSVDAWF
ncbi:MAG TPA: hypothetical protein DE060_02880 [Lentisphaeria bacterium]|nr:hypothetical protein [Lentisphaeria bacterium]HCG48135.1 hypothetical protein [Lentisphaeria bacterium]